MKQNQVREEGMSLATVQGEEGQCRWAGRRATAASALTLSSLGAAAGRRARREWRRAEPLPLTTTLRHAEPACALRALSAPPSLPFRLSCICLDPTINTPLCLPPFPRPRHAGPARPPSTGGPSALTPAPSCLAVLEDCSLKLAGRLGGA